MLDGPGGELEVELHRILTLLERRIVAPACRGPAVVDGTGRGRPIPLVLDVLDGYVNYAWSVVVTASQVIVLRGPCPEVALGGGRRQLLTISSKESFLIPSTQALAVPVSSAWSSADGK
ncbi:hypothetical protein GCM10009836_24210 [Pseudonocardia ailaonensis]|uniref:Uncharacterized protein n=1 Tax=Pseudonocardia ailaonensis TaxID=367279 RepID=A0ABN2MZ30_9PSEU